MLGPQDREDRQRELRAALVRHRELSRMATEAAAEAQRLSDALRLEQERDAQRADTAA